MPNIATILRDEITRISRRETKKQIFKLQRLSAVYRRDIAALKREVLQLQRLLKQKNRAAPIVPAQTEKNGSGFRFVAKGFRTLRRRLGLSAAQMGKLLSVSEQSIYNWETKIARPRSAHLPAIARLRKMSKREVQGALN